MPKGIYVRNPKPLSVRFWKHVEKSDGCWLWMGARKPTGHGNINMGGGKYDGAHRVSWRLTHGEIPEGMEICHTCDNGQCVNPAHLFLGTHRDNVLDMMQKDRGGGQFQEQSHCKRGHPLSGENLRVRPGGVRSCRECSRNGQRARRVAEFSRRTS